MSTVYDRAPASVAKRGQRIIEQYHSALKAAAATIDYAFAFNDEGPAVTGNGYPADAKVKVVSLKDRALGRADAEIIIDANRWESFTDAEQDALLDHEIQHLKVRTNAVGAILYDDCKRPKLQLRNHDHQFGWFDCIARRHGLASGEVRQAMAFVAEVGKVYLQGEFDFSADKTEQAAQAVRSVTVLERGKRRTFGSAKEAAEFVVAGCKAELERQREAGE